MAKVGKRVKKSKRALIEELEPMVRRAWHQSVRDLANDLNFAALKRAIEDKDMEGVYAALRLDESFVALENGLRRAFKAGGTMTMNILEDERKKALG